MRKVFFLIFILLFSRAALAHEYWLEPDKFFLAPNELIVVRLFVGEGLKKQEERPFQRSRTAAFSYFSLEAITELKSLMTEAGLPFYFTGAKPGNYLFAIERKPAYIKIDAQKFEDYLREEGMEYIIDERKKLGESAKEGRERYSRFIKMMLQVGESRDTVFKRLAGSKLEISAKENPYAKKIGDTLEFWVTFDKKPLANKTVFADNRNGEAMASQKLQTDAKGRFKVKLDQKGIWLIRLVVMQRCQKDCAEADWESFWGAYSFGVK